MRKLIYCLVFLLAPLTSMAGTLLHRTAPSALLGGMPQVDYTIYLPDSMTEGSSPLPICSTAVAVPTQNGRTTVI